MNECHQRLWEQKIAKSFDAPKLCSLPPTAEAFMQNVKRAHFQVTYWYAAMEPEPPPLNPQDFGWEADDINKSLSHTTVTKFVCVVPDYVLKLMRCGCDSELACKTGKCMWVYRSPNPMYNMLHLWGWTNMFEQVHFYQNDRRLC